MVFFDDVVGYASLVRVFVGRITPNLLVSGVFGTVSQGLSSWSGLN